MNRDPATRRDVTELLAAWSSGDAGAREELMPLPVAKAWLHHERAPLS